MRKLYNPNSIQPVAKSEILAFEGETVAKFNWRGKFGMRSNVRVYDPTVGELALVGIPKNDSIELSLSDHPVVVEIR